MRGESGLGVDSARLEKGWSRVLDMFPALGGPLALRSLLGSPDADGGYALSPMSRSIATGNLARSLPRLAHTQIPAGKIRDFSGSRDRGEQG